MSEKQPLNCHQSKDHLDNLIEAMVEARINPDAHSLSGPSEFFDACFEPIGPLKKHLAECSECHNYQLANRIIIESARSLPLLQGDEDLTQSILSSIDFSAALAPALALNIPATSVQSTEKQSANQTTVLVSTKYSPLILAVSFIAFALATSLSAGASIEAIWSTGSWALALVMVAMLKPLIEGNAQIKRASNSMAKV